MKINKNLILSLFVAFVLVMISCSKKEAEALDINFSLDNHNLFSLNKDYSEDDFDLYKNDPDKVFYSLVGHPIKIKTSEDVGFMDGVKWKLNDKLWEVSGNPNDFTYAFKLPGLYKISMKVNGVEVTKFVRTIEDEKAKQPKESGEVKAKKNTNGDENIEFTIDNDNPNKWQAILLQDVSSITDEIKRRVWDFGDGTVIPTVGNSVKYSYSKSGVYEIKLCLNFTDKCTKKKIIVNDKNELESSGVGMSDERLKKKLNDKSATDSQKGNNNTTRKINDGKTTSHLDSKKLNVESSSNHSPTSTGDRSNIEKENKSETIEIHEVKMSVPRKGNVGTPIRIVDLTSPAEAVKYRNWYVNGLEQNFHQKSIDMIFDKVGTFKIKMCLNYLSKNCIEKEIVITKKGRRKNPQLSAPVGPLSVPYEKRSPTPEFEPLTEQSTPSVEFLCQSYGKAGAVFDYKCVQNVEYYNGVSMLRLKPQKDMELHSAKIAGNTIGFVDVVISDIDKSEVAVLKRVQVLPGKTTVEFAELALTLKEGKQYELTIATLPQKSKKQKKLKLLNSSNCQVPQYDNKSLIIDYQDGVQLLYDIKFCY